MSGLVPRADPWARDPNVLYVRPSVDILGADFGRRELGQIALAIAGLVAVFACGMAGGVASPGFLVNFLILLPVALVACAPTFFVSMYLQKRIGASQGCTVEFQVNPQWLGISVFFSALLGFVFAIPGSVQKFGNLTRIGGGKMALASPGTFLVAAAAAAAVIMVTGPPVGSYAFLFLLFAVRITSLFAIFQLIPFAGLPGLDIWRWSKVVFALALSLAVVLLLSSQLPGMLIP